MNQALKKLTDERGKMAEYLVNNTLNSKIGAVRYRGYSTEENMFLFPGLILPVDDAGNLTEIDHVFLSPKGVFAIETKSISGKVFGEASSMEWHSAKSSRGHDEGIFDRGFKNPFKQNHRHINPIKYVTGTKWVNNIVVIVDADASGWRPGLWSSKPVKDLYINPFELANNIADMNTIFSPMEIKALADKLVPFILRADELQAKFFKNLNTHSS